MISQVVLNAQSPELETVYGFHVPAKVQIADFSARRFLLLARLQIDDDWAPISHLMCRRLINLACPIGDEDPGVSLTAGFR